jgi:hypothetical protein
LLKRLLYHYHPDLMTHLSHTLSFTPNLFPLVQWIMTLFAHAVPLSSLTGELWTEIFCQPVDHLVFLALTILGGAFKPKILVMRDLSEVLSSLKGMNELVEVSEVVREARRMRGRTPESMIIAEFTPKAESKEVE